MLKPSILSPQVNSLLSRVRPTNTLVVAERGFPFWSGVETIDLSLVDCAPTALHGLEAVRANFSIGEVRMATQSLDHSSAGKKAAFAHALKGTGVTYEDCKNAFLRAIGLVRTGDATHYANLILITQRANRIQ
jgi:D-ribose pyranase